MIERQLGGESVICGISEPGRGALPSPPATSQGRPLQALPVLQLAGLVSFATASVLPARKLGAKLVSSCRASQEGVAWQSQGQCGASGPRGDSTAVLQMGSQSSGAPGGVPEQRRARRLEP